MFPSKLVNNYVSKKQKKQVHVPLMIMIIINIQIISTKSIGIRPNTCTIYSEFNWNEFNIKA